MFETRDQYRFTIQFSLLAALCVSLAATLIVLAPLWYAWPRRDFPVYGMIAFSVAVFAATALFLSRTARRRNRILKTPFPLLWEQILSQRVAFYRSLDVRERERFRRAVQIFCAEKKITGIGADVDDTVRLLVAASAVIPVFRYPDFEYRHVHEILIYPQSFDDNFSASRRRADLHGLLAADGSTIVISRPALLAGFAAGPGTMHVGIHEFVHSLDGTDGMVDGVPAIIIDKDTENEWREIMHAEMRSIEEGRSDIDPYALSSEAEFFAVASEYFFRNPKEFSRRHGRLYSILRKMFGQDHGAGQD